ncbi:MAG TPA: ribonuclease Z [Chitinophagales bacterium]|nr:ribonuclease Z [Chitinophagales bacterium]
MQFDVTILGSNAAIPAHDRHPSSQIIDYNGHLFMVDCGEGTQFQMLKYGVKRGRLDHIFISHLHGDHFFGLVALLTSLNLNWRETDLHLYGPPALNEIIQLHFKHSKTELRYKLFFHPTTDEKPEVIFENKVLSVETFALRHRLPTTGFIFKEKQGLRNILPEKITEYNIPVDKIIEIKKGAGFTGENGQVISNKELTRDPAPPRSYAYCSDTIYTQGFLERIKGVSLLYHEATFIEEHAFRAQETFHSTAKQAADIAKRAGAEKLLLGHFSARYDNLSQLLSEGREVFPDTELAEEGKKFAV